MPTPYNISAICPTLIGRATQLAALTDLIAQAYAGHGRVALIAGEASIGKSRLVAEVKAIAAQRCMSVVQGRAFPYVLLLDLLLPR